MPRKGNFKLLEMVQANYGGKDVPVFLPIQADRELESTQDAEKYITEKAGEVSGTIAILDLKKVVKVEVKKAVVIEEQAVAPSVETDAPPEPTSEENKPKEIEPPAPAAPEALEAE